MNPDTTKNAETEVKQSQEFIRAKNKKTKAYNRDVMLRNFLRKHR